MYIFIYVFCNISPFSFSSEKISFEKFRVDLFQNNDLMNRELNRRNSLEKIDSVRDKLYKCVKCATRFRSRFRLRTLPVGEPINHKAIR